MPLPPPWLIKRNVLTCRMVRVGSCAVVIADVFSVMRPGDNEGEDHRRMPWFLCRTPDPHDTGPLRMHGQTYLDRAIDDERFRTLCRF